MKRQELLKHSPSLASYLMVLGNLVNFRLMHEEDEAAYKGRDIIKKLNEDIDNVYSAAIQNGEDGGKAVRYAFEASYRGKARRLLNAIYPEQKLLQALKGNWVEDVENIDMIFWQVVLQELNRMEVKGL